MTHDREFNTITNPYLDQIAQSLGYCLFREINDPRTGQLRYIDFLHLDTLERCKKHYDGYRKIDISKSSFLGDTPTIYKSLQICTIEGIHKNTLRRLVREYLYDNAITEVWNQRRNIVQSA